MKVVYTSLDGFKLKKWQVKSIEDLPQEYYEWVNEHGVKLLGKRNQIELKAGKELRMLYKDVQEQVYFNIFGRSYYLDYYIPHRRLAIEIDGGYHKDNKKHDNIRDKDFNKIGIRTIRILAKDVGNIKDVLEKMLTKKQKKKETQRKRITVTINDDKRFASAYKRLKQHNSMKHKASWI